MNWQSDALTTWPILILTRLDFIHTGLDLMWDPAEKYSWKIFANAPSYPSFLYFQRGIRAHRSGTHRPRIESSMGASSRGITDKRANRARDASSTGRERVCCSLHLINTVCYCYFCVLHKHGCNIHMINKRQEKSGEKINKNPRKCRWQEFPLSNKFCNLSNSWGGGGGGGRN